MSNGAFFHPFIQISLVKMFTIFIRKSKMNKRERKFVERKRIKSEMKEHPKMREYM